MIDRRRLILGSLQAAGLLGLPLATGLTPQAMAQDGTAAVQRVNEHSFVISGAGGNVLVRNADQGGLLVVDGGHRDHAEQVWELIREHSSRDRIDTLYNTHWHPEQTGLNALASQQQARIFAHENTRQWLSTTIRRRWEQHTHPPLPEAERPNQTIYHYGSSDHGGTQVDYGYLRQAHTDGDIYIYFPEDDILHAGGVVSNDGWPFMDWWTGGWIMGLAQAYQRLLDVAGPNTMIVPANGPLMDYQALQEMAAMYDTLAQRIRSMFMAANTVEQSVAARPAAEYEDKMGNADLFVALSHDSLIPHITPDA